MRSDRAWARWAVPVLVLLATIKTTQGLYGTFDVWFDDETAYLEAAVRHVEPGYLPLADSSPLYPLWYKFLHLFVADPLTLYFVNWYVLNLSLPLILYALARRSGASLGVAAAVGIAWSFSGAVVTWPFVSKFACLVIGVGALASTYVRDKRLAAAVTVLALSAAAYARAEYAMPSFAFGALVVLWSLVRLAMTLRARSYRRRGRKRLMLLLAMVVAAGAPVGFRALFGDPSVGHAGSGGRAFFAFQQHYALNVVEDGQIPTDPWTNWEPFFRKAFPTAKSIGEAARENPTALAWHLKRNLHNLPLNIEKLLHPLPHLPLLISRLTILALAVIFVFGLFAFVFRRHGLDRKLAGWLPLIFVVAVTTGGSSMIVYPREHYLVPFVWLMQGAVAAACGSLTRPHWLMLRYWVRIPRFLRRTLMGPGGLVVTRRRLVGIPLVLVLSLLVAALPSRSGKIPALMASLGPPPSDPLEGVRTIKALRLFDLKGKVVLLESDHSRGVYAQLDFVRVPQWAKHAPFWEFMHGTWVNAIVINNRLRWDSRFFPDPEWQAFIHGGPHEDFEFFDVPNTNVQIAIRKSLLATAHKR